MKCPQEVDAYRKPVVKCIEKLISAFSVTEQSKKLFTIKFILHIMQQGTFTTMLSNTGQDKMAKQSNGAVFRQSALQTQILLQASALSRISVCSGITNMRGTQCSGVKRER